MIIVDGVDGLPGVLVTFQKPGGDVAMGFIAKGVVDKNGFSWRLRYGHPSLIVYDSLVAVNKLRRAKPLSRSLKELGDVCSI